MPNASYIALADDDPEDQEMLAERFHKDHPGVPFKFFKSGQEITRYLQSCPDSDMPALVILDYKMPFQTGADVLRILQADNRFKAIPKIVWSTSGNSQYVNECLQNGAEKYFTKPNNVQQLDQIVAEISNILHSQSPVRQ